MKFGIVAPLLAVSKVCEPSHTLTLPTTVGELGRLLRKTMTVSIDGGQTPFEIVQASKVVPMGTLLNVVFGLLGAAILPDPERIDHCPVPVVAMLAFNVVVESHITMSGPANAGVGNASRVITTVSLLGGQTPLVIDQTKVLTPGPIAVRLVLGPAGVTMVPDPPKRYQSPVPTTGALPVTDVDCAQMS